MSDSCKVYGIPLSLLGDGEKAVVTAVKGGSEVVRHLHALGFVEGACIAVEATGGKGDIIVSVKDVRMALSKEIAIHVLVDDRLACCG